MSKLTLRYEYDASFYSSDPTRDDFGKLSITAESGGFSGEGEFWVQWQDVCHFGESLAAFPIPADAPIVAQWGFEQLEGDDLILRVEVAAANVRGDLSVRFEIADQYERECRIRGKFFTNYAEIAEFRTGIARLMKRESDEAVLHGQR